MELETNKCINLKKLAEMIGDDEAFIREILTDFYDELSMLTDRIEIGFDNVEDDDLKLHVHTLKGICGNVCAQDLHEILINIDKALKNENLKEATHNFGAFLNAKRVVTEFLQKYLGLNPE